MSQQIRHKINPMLVILKKHNWAMNPVLYTAKHRALAIIQMHGLTMKTHMYDEMFKDLFDTVNRVRLSSRDPQIYEDITKIDEDIKKVNQLV